uniref:K Homology domain-containing protein n=1 Tax=Noctiluca scintillans TaxID=2966 RepID=A0A7S1A7X6_NOCSC
MGVAVEVRKNPKSTTWYMATILDVRGDLIRVSFEDAIWPCRDVPASSVRRCPAREVEDDFSPNVDDIVEVSVSASESNPCGWCLGRVKTIKNAFYFIGFVGGNQKGQDLIVERSALRLRNSELPIDAAKLQRRLVSPDAELRAWISTPDSQGCLNQVQRKARLLLALWCKEEHPKVLLIGDERAVSLAEKLLEIHFRYQVEMQRFHEQRLDFIERLSERQRWYNSQAREEFTVEQGLMGKIIGKKGEHIRPVRERHGVEITLVDDNRPDRSTTTIIVTGPSVEAVRKAREELEYVTVKVPIEASQIGWILGKNLQNITDIARKAELHYARFDAKNNAVELFGLRHQVDVAKLLIEVHLEYLPVYHDMDQEQDAIQQSFDELDGSKKGKKGKGNEWGKGKDWEKGNKDIDQEEDVRWQDKKGQGRGDSGKRAWGSKGRGTDEDPRGVGGKNGGPDKKGDSLEEAASRGPPGDGRGKRGGRKGGK